jgi:transcriptional regulator with XRE-family HTH domain
MSAKSKKAAKPDATLHNPSPEYLRDLLLKAGVTQLAAAKAIGITERVLRYYLSDTQSASYRPAPYVVQYALEQLAA